MPQYFKAGKLAASHGLKGELILQHNLGKKTSLKGLTTIFIEQSKENFLPYFVTDTKIKSDNEVYIKLDGIDIMEQARKLTPKEIWLEEADFKKYSSSTSPISFLNYTLFEGETEIGKIIEVIEQPHQILCTVIYKGNEAYIPLHDDNLEKIDKKTKRIFCQIPEGLLDIYG